MDCHKTRFIEAYNYSSAERDLTMLTFLSLYAQVLGSNHIFHAAYCLIYDHLNACLKLSLDNFSRKNLIYLPHPFGAFTLQKKKKKKKKKKNALVILFYIYSLHQRRQRSLLNVKIKI